MKEPFTQLYVHIVWATWNREPLLTPELRTSVYACIKVECEKLGAEMIAVGGMADHTHLLARFPTTVALATLVKQVKGASSHLVNKCLGGDSFKWQGCYAAFTVSKALGPTVRAYILGQEQHHKDKTTDKDMEVAWEENE